MSNMSYCRFENTYRDLVDCKNNLFAEIPDTNKSEVRYRQQLVELCREIADAWQEAEEDEDELEEGE